MKLFHLSVVALALAVPVVTRAQDPNPQRPPLDRVALEERVRERMTSMIKTRLGLTDDQVKKLGETNSKYEERRRLLQEQERDVRMGIRDELLLGDKANQARVGDLLDRLLKVQRQRLDVVESEQKELAAFLTPVQRVKFHALQDQMRKWREEARRGGGGNRMPGQGPGPRPGPPGGPVPNDSKNPG